MEILQVCAYGAPYPGNFINSLLLLEEKLNKKGYKIIYAFSESAKGKQWCKEIQNRTKVYFLPVAKGRILPKTYKTFKRIYKENDIDIVHSHFELYDIPATVMSPKNTKVFWHLHDSIESSKRMGRNLLNKLQYSMFSKRSNLISVSDFYRKKVIEMGFNKNNTCTILNGIDLSRIKECDGSEKSFTFLTFGWAFYTKGSDIIFGAIQKLHNDGYNVKLLFNGNIQTWVTVNKYFNDKLPEWLELCEPVPDVNQLFEKAELFIQASRRETFSYAVCEAAYAGLPVIASDIPGLKWAKKIPSIKFFENENVDQLYEMLKNFLDGQVMVDNNTIEETRNIIASEFSLNVWCENIIKVYGLR